MAASHEENAQPSHSAGDWLRTGCSTHSGWLAQASALTACCLAASSQISNTLRGLLIVRNRAGIGAWLWCTRLR